MIINVKSSALMTKSGFTETAESINYPAVLIDNRFKIVAKTKSVNRFLKGVRVGTKIVRFLPESAVFEIENMEIESVFHTSFSTQFGKFPVVVISNGDCRLVVFNQLFSELLDTATAIYSKMSGYDNKLNDKNNPFKDCPDAVKAILGDVLKSFETTRPLPFFDVSALISCILSELKNKSAALDDRIKFVPIEDKLLTSGNERDFAAVLILLLSFLLENGSDISLSVAENHDTIKISLVGNADFGFCGRINIRRFLQSSKENENFEFFLYLAKLLTDANLWELELSEDENGVSRLNIILPLLRSGEEFLLREEVFGFVKELINSVF